jgi:hypothetical protein
MRKVLLPALLCIPLTAHAHEPHVCDDDLPDAAVLSGHLEHADIVAGAVELSELLEAGKKLFVASLSHSSTSAMARGARPRRGPAISA